MRSLLILPVSFWAAPNSKITPPHLHIKPLPSSTKGPCVARTLAQHMQSTSRNSITMAATTDPAFPCSLTIEVPFPTSRLASTALQALQVDKELSPLVSRTFALAPSEPAIDASPETSVLRVEYKATTNRMLRVAVNSVMESLGLIIEVMGELDEDVLAARDQAETRLAV
ncbi:transcription factor Pcc1-domain-containing protein [Xylaria acuta]|nr:transcription factor Pcc1-domain-containing protein [Xylaria acuta]